MSKRIDVVSCTLVLPDDMELVDVTCLQDERKVFSVKGVAPAARASGQMPRCEGSATCPCRSAA